MENREHSRNQFRLFHRDVQIAIFGRLSMKTTGTFYLMLTLLGVYQLGSAHENQLPAPEWHPKSLQAANGSLFRPRYDRINDRIDRRRQTKDLVHCQ